MKSREAIAKLKELERGALHENSVTMAKWQHARRQALPVLLEALEIALEALEEQVKTAESYTPPHNLSCEVKPAREALAKIEGLGWQNE